MASVNIITIERTDAKVWQDNVRAVLSMSNKFCQKVVSRKYIRDKALKNANCLLVGYVPGREVRGIATLLMGGFLILNEVTYEKQGFLYIDVVCADQSGVGSALLEQAERRAKQRQLKGLILFSLAHAVGYYRKLGYRHREACVEEDPDLSQGYVEMVKPLIDTWKGASAKEITKAINSRAQEGIAYRRFLELLQTRDLVYDKGCKTLKKCSINGYVMTKCFHETPGATPTHNLARSSAASFSKPKSTKPKSTKPKSTKSRSTSSKSTKSKSAKSPAPRSSTRVRRRTSRYL